MDRIISATKRAILLKPELITGDAINALAGGHGMLSIAAYSAANAIAEQALKGKRLKLGSPNKARAAVDDVVEQGVAAAKKFGADPSNAALVTACLCYIAGCNTRAGVPSGNRKLGALARLKAGAQKGGIAILPTPKMNNKISGFAAVQKLYEAMFEGRLTRIDGIDVPPGVSGTPLVGHSAVGEDYIFPEVAENGARAGAEGMMAAYRGVGLRPNPWISAVFGAAAALEALHCDAPAPERFGAGMSLFIPTVAGIGAVKATGLPVKLHFKGTNEEFDTAQVIGDAGLILKDIGTPTVVGMLAFNEIFGCFEESKKIGAGGSGGPRTAPIGHMMADIPLALRILVSAGSIEDAAEVIEKCKREFVDPCMGFAEANTMARKAQELCPGPVSEAVVCGTQPETEKMIEERAKMAWVGYTLGETVTEVVKQMEAMRVERVNKGVSELLSREQGREIKVEVTKLEGGARRPGKIAKRLYVLDPDVDVTLTVDGETTEMKAFAHEYIPDAILSKDEERLKKIPLVVLAVGELMVTGHTLIDLECAVAVAALMGVKGPKEAAEEAVSRGSLITGGLPGVAPRAIEVAEIALNFYRDPDSL